ncbi:hypothetical protein [Aureimonas sp. AU12]|uniref:hypothetical protein n=1 Tax=Aureimonas sp. AU12 TaxID=1638161 RepID=UPI0012E3694F|nr:hypothetical protein [Aureimonas sp. AU12]
MSVVGGGAGPVNGFKLVWGEIKRRTKKPRLEVVYWCYFAGAVCILGGIGIISELLKYYYTGSSSNASGIYASLATFFPALIGASVMQMMFEQTVNRRLQAISFIFLMVTFGFAVYLNGFAAHSSKLSWFSVVVFCIFSLWVWWISNADNAGLYDEPSIDAPTGGVDPGADLQGDTSGFQL